MAIDPESLYLQLGQLVAEMPQLGGTDPITAETYRWLGRAVHLVEQTGDLVDPIGLSIASNSLDGMLRNGNAAKIVAIVYRALARAEANAPAAARGAFVGIGADFDAFKAFGEILKQARLDVLIVDAYLNDKALTDFVPLAAEGIQVRLLGDKRNTDTASLKPAAERWVKQYGTIRPLEVRLSPPRALHDRLIAIDGGAAVWTISQSLKDFASRSPALVQRVDPDLAKAKAGFYIDLWNAATPLI